MIENSVSGSLHPDNIKHINKLYDTMKEALIQESNMYNYQNYGQPIITNYPPNALFATHKVGDFKGKIFGTIRGQKVFNIIKDPMNLNRRQNVKIVYSGGIEQSQAYEDEYIEDKEEYYDEEKADENHENIEENHDPEKVSDHGENNIFDQYQASSLKNIFNTN